MASTDGFRTKLERIAEEDRRYSQMPLESRMNELRKLRQRRKGFERALSITDTRIMLLEHMPDIARERVKNDQLALALLGELKERGDIAYRNFVEGGDEAYRMFVVHYLHLLKTAELVDMPSDPTFPSGMDSIIKLTERGRTFQYAEQK